MNSLDNILALISPKEHKRSLIALYPILNVDAQSEVTLRIAQFDERDKSIDDSFKAICDCVSLITGVDDIHLTTSRRRGDVMARQMVVYCACAEFVATRKLTLKSVGAYFDKHFSHALIIHSRKNIADLYMTDIIIKNQMDAIALCLYQNGLIQTSLCLK
jgi:chromosomal replication initiation ATPase DnaA